jgi:RNA polymerase sigma-70 factor (ECF subfamily)
MTGRAYISALAGYALVDTESDVFKVGALAEAEGATGRELRHFLGVYPDISIVEADPPSFVGVRQQLSSAVERDRVVRLVLALLDSDHSSSLRSRAAALAEARLRQPGLAEFLLHRFGTLDLSPDVVAGGLAHLESMSAVTRLTTILTRLLETHERAKNIRLTLSARLGALSLVEQQEALQYVSQRDLIGVLSNWDTTTACDSGELLQDVPAGARTALGEWISQSAAGASDRQVPSSPSQPGGAPNDADVYAPQADQDSSLRVQLLRDTLQRNRWNVAAAAEGLALSRAHFYGAMATAPTASKASSLAESASRHERGAELSRPGLIIDASLGIDELVAEGARHWPSLKLDPAIFRRHMESTVYAQEQLTVGPIHVGDLFLACSCLHLSRAIEIFERTYAPQIRSVAVLVESSPTFLKELESMLRLRLFVAENERPPGLARYSGRGPLAAWTRIVAQRLALQLARESVTGLERESAAALVASVAREAEDPAYHYMREVGQRELRAAFQAAIAELRPTDLAFVRLRLSQDLPIREIAVMYGIHETTASRRLHAIFRDLRERAKIKLRQRLQLSVSECESLVRHARSSLGLSSMFEHA